LIFAVLDTNIVVSGMIGISLRTQSAPSLVLRHWAGGRFDLAISDHIIEEVRRTLAKPWFASRISPDDIDAVLTPLLRSSVYVTVAGRTLRPPIASHPEDDLILETVAAAEADVLVTGDAMLLKLAEYGRAPIVSARHFLDMLDLDND
jgi:putative PIN family toxin of toxin-antitoxin system